MKCTNCGFEQEQPFRFCPSCGTDSQPEAQVRNAAADKILPALKDSLFLVICILMAASCVLSIANEGLPLLSILLTVFLWLTWNQARSNNADVQQLRNISGTVYANYIINNVLAILLLVVGIILSLAFNMLVGNPEFWDELLSEFDLIDQSYAVVVGTLSSISGGIVMFFFAVISIAILLINIFAMRRIHRFTKSVYLSVEKQIPALKCVQAAKVWLFIFGGIGALGALSSLAAFQLLPALSSGCSAATAILAGVLINKYFAVQN